MLESIWAAVSNPLNWWIIFTLVLLEGLLSADNALVLAIMVKHLPEKQRRKALLYGIWGAFIFRMIAIAVGAVLIKIWWIKIIGGLYLIQLAVKHFLPKKDKEKEIKPRKLRGFWPTVAAVEMMDIAFSIDSVLTALGVSDQLWVLYAGGILGILTMRFIAGFIITLIERIPELEVTAYLMISIIGANLVAEALGYHIGKTILYIILGILLVGSFVVHYSRKAIKGGAQP